MYRHIPLIVIAMYMAILGCAGYAWAESNPTAATQDVKMTVPGIFWIGWDGDKDKDEGDLVFFNLTEADIDATTALLAAVDTLSARSNYDNVTLKVLWPYGEWESVNPLSEADFDLWIDWGDGWSEFPLTGLERFIVLPPNDGLSGDWDIDYKLTELGLDDDPDTYTTSILFRLSRP